MLKMLPLTYQNHKGTALKCLLWFCLVFSYICSLGGTSLEKDCFTLHKKTQGEMIRKYCCDANNCMPVLLRKGTAEKNFGQKNRRKWFKDGSNNVFGFDAILPPWYLSLQSQELNKRSCIFAKAHPLPCECACHILVRAGPATV